MKTIFISLLPLFSFLVFHKVEACTSQVSITLENNRGGFYANQKVTLKAKSGAPEIQQISNAAGVVTFSLPCQTAYTVSISNYARSFELISPKAGGHAMQTVAYAPDMQAKAKLFAMNNAEMAEVDQTALLLPDTVLMPAIAAIVRQKPTHFMRLRLQISDFNGKALNGEQIILSADKRNLAYKGQTNSAGILYLQVLKGDTYHLHFLYDSNFAVETCLYTRGMSESEISLSYLGSNEIRRRKAIETARIAAEEKRLKADAAAFKAWCRKLKISEAEGHRRKLLEPSETDDTVVMAVFTRNNWNDKLIVCDLTGSMLPYTAQLSVWYQLRSRHEKRLQFVFFNDGDGLQDAEKVIGRTGGIYYMPDKGLDSLRNLIAKVSARGSGGDCPENNMEALITGSGLAKPFKSLVMIADNNAPVKDIALLSRFKTPVHIILCGVANGEVHTDYLNIARKTGGSVHTIEEDITGLAQISEGQELNIGGFRYRIMGGNFVLLNKV